MSASNINQTEKKKFPYSCDKKKLFEMYALDMTSRQIRNGINAIIKENRGLPKFGKVMPRQIWHKELIEFMETYGLPRNYEL
ncbi:hypothetical protein FLCU109888_11480 [Flavobacterium cucumis]|uniref:Uncharacterized protein n=1 Tax=Flavobacterium cucumis TaxID=416016 RepID=A0A1M7ZVH2_9FLAO|nr:hypothetical protein [Flavobacterium cucumis]SHO72872.1 hypothetical protein SAMN05443547_1216 [Flavobacterium cucumis]